MNLIILDRGGFHYSGNGATKLFMVATHWTDIIAAKPGTQTKSWVGLQEKQQSAMSLITVNTADRVV